MSSRNASAAPSMAGYLIQVHRALDRLSTCSDGDLVGVETLDDVATINPETGEFLEQDKLSLQGEPITDRSRVLWRTLDIWSSAWGERGPREAHFGLSTNRPLVGDAILLLAVANGTPADNAKIFSLLRRQAATEAGEDDRTLQALINRVIGRGEGALMEVIRRTSVQNGPGVLDMELVTATKKRLLFAGMGVDEGMAYEGLVGWLHLSLLSKWFRHEEAWIAKSEFNRQVYRIAENLKQAPILPLAARLISVSESEIDQTLGHRFVTHLARIDVTKPQLDGEITHYLRFFREKLRLTATGDYLAEHWLDRSDRLKEHWSNIKRRRCLASRSETKIYIGQSILNEASGLREPLADVGMAEAYMTIGHFHRLADEDRIAWHPDCQCKE